MNSQHWPIRHFFLTEPINTSAERQWKSHIKVAMFLNVFNLYGEVYAYRKFFHLFALSLGIKIPFFRVRLLLSRGRSLFTFCYHEPFDTFVFMVLYGSFFIFHCYFHLIWANQLQLCSLPPHDFDKITLFVWINLGQGRCLFFISFVLHCFLATRLFKVYNQQFLKSNMLRSKSFDVLISK